MRWDVTTWAAVALLLFAAEALAPGAFMLWMGFAAVVVFLGVLLVPGIPLLFQVVAFVVLSFVSIPAVLNVERIRTECASPHAVLV